MDLPTITTKLLESMELGEIKICKDMIYHQVSGYIIRASKTGMKFSQKRALLVMSIDETTPVMLITRIK